MSKHSIWQTLRRWLVGESFHLRTNLSEAECQQRFARYLPDIGLSPPVTGDPAVVWKYNRVYVWLPWVNRGPRLVGKLRPSGQGVEIVGRAGADDVSLIAALAMEAIIVKGLLTYGPLDPILWALPLAPVAIFLWHRNSPDGGHLIDFLGQLLGAEDVLARKGNAVIRA